MRLRRLINRMAKNILLREHQPGQLHSVLREQLRSTLKDQAPGERLSSERLLAKQFGVSTATVSRALQELQEEGLLRRIPGKGTFLALDSGPGSVANTGLGGAEPDTLGRAVMRENSFAGAFAGAGSALGEPNPRASIGHLNAWIVVQLESFETSIDRSSESWPQRTVSRLEYLITSQGGRAQAVLGHTMSEDQCAVRWRHALEQGINCVFYVVNDQSRMADVWAEQFIHTLTVHEREAKNGSRPLPCVVQISFSHTHSSFFDTVSFDGELGSYLATAHLLGLGHREIVFARPALSMPWLDLRVRGFHRALRSHGQIVPREDGGFRVIAGECEPGRPDMWEQLGRDIADQVAGLPDVTAVVLTNDQMANGFVARARESGRAIPEELSVIGFDDRFDSVLQGLTTIHPPIEELADAALDMASTRRSGSSPREHLHRILKPTVMVRGTTKAKEDTPDNLHPL